MIDQMTVTESFQAEKEKVLIIGDLIIDRNIYCTVPKISPEAPVPVAMIEPNGIIESPGGAGLAASFAAKNNIPFIFLSLYSKETKSLLQQYKIPSLLIEEIQHNVRKTRYIDINSNYHLLRVDTDKISILSSDKTLLINLQKIFNNLLETNNIKGIILLDYDKGLFKDEVISQYLIQEAHINSIPIYVDSRSKDLSKFANANFLKLNLNEYNYSLSTGINPLHDLYIDKLIITKGAQGAEIQWVEKDKKLCFFNHKTEKNYLGSPDVTGCGDVFDVTFFSSWCINKMDEATALKIAVEKATEYAYQSTKERLNVNI